MARIKKSIWEEEGEGVRKFKGLMTSLRTDWKTPKRIYDVLDREFHFDFDPCPSNPQFDGLKIEWGQHNFINPPYGRTIIEWLAKGHIENKKGKLCVFLIPSRTDTKWWSDFVMRADEIRFIEGRLKFSDHKNSAPFPSAIAIFKEKIREGPPK